MQDYGVNCLKGAVMQAYELKDSGVDCLGNIPSHWVTGKIKNRFFLKPSNVDKKSYDDEIPVELCNYVDVYYNDFITNDLVFMSATATDYEIQKFSLNIDDVIITKDSEDPMDIGVPALVKEVKPNLVCGYHLTMLRKRPCHVSGSFLFWALKDEAIASQFYREATGVTRWAISSRNIKNVAIAYPKLNEQKTIADYLDQACQSIDKTISLKQQQLTSIVKQQDDIIQTAVNKGIYRNIELKNSGIDWIGDIPIHWKVKRLKRVLKESEYGISVSTEEEGKFSVLKMGNIVNRKINDSKIEFVQEVDENLLVKNDDLLFNRTNSHDQVGKVGIYNGILGENVTYASYLVRLRPNHLCSPHFLNYYLNNSAFLSFARRMAIPSVQQANLNPNRYGRLEIAVPPIEEQHDIVKFLDIEINNLEKLKEVLQNQIKTLIQYRQSLIHECVTGKKRVYQVTH
ncbi:MAG: hypothetical protein RLZ75_3308 [Pseudomonadota bacterium]